MEENIIISNLNDFIFCPRSIYFHNLYSQHDEHLYHSSFQANGNSAHKNINLQEYSSTKSVLEGIDIYSEELGLVGKIDLFDAKTKTLIERKREIKKIYDGYLLQIYAQYYCLIEMGYEVKKLKFYSLVDNKNYDISLPTNVEKNKLIDIIQQMRTYNLEDNFTQNQNKCKMCIYRELCDIYKGDSKDDEQT